ncbi:polysaccharide lyase [Thalassotalea agariperforans]
MKFLKLIPIFLLFIYGCSANMATTKLNQPKHTLTSILTIDFEQSPLGLYSNHSIKNEWPQINWANVYQRAEIIKDETQGKVIRMFYPQGGLGPRETGGQFEVKLPAATEYTLSYKIKFEHGFDFAKGGKLPGLTSGGAKFTGGNHPNNGEGWSARFMWRAQGTAELYLYYVDMKTKWGEQLPLNGVTFKTGQWYEIKQHIKLNQSHQKNAKITAWVDGNLVMEKTNFRLRLGEQGLINCFYFSTFFGGNSRDWVPKHDSFIRFDDFVINTH